MHILLYSRLSFFLFPFLFWIKCTFYENKLNGSVIYNFFVCIWEVNVWKCIKTSSVERRKSENRQHNRIYFSFICFTVTSNLMDFFMCSSVGKWWIRFCGGMWRGRKGFALYFPSNLLKNLFHIWTLENFSLATILKDLRSLIKTSLSV